jgi:hypothetical protein
MLQDLLCPDNTGCAGTIVDRDRLTESRAHPFGDDPRHDVDRSTDGGRHDQPDRSRWVALRVGIRHGSKLRERKDARKH